MGDSSGSEDDEVDMRQQPAEQEDDDDDDEDAGKGGGKARDDDVSDDGGEEEDDDDDDDDDSDEEDRKRGKKKRGRKDGSKYIDMEAGEGDSDDEEESGRAKKKSREADYGDDDDAEMSAEQQEREMQRATERRRGPDFMHKDDLREEDFKNRYRTVDDDDEELEDVDDENMRNARLPSNKDPKVWCVKVANGQEQSLCVQLLQKFVTLTAQGSPLNITAVYCNEQAHGFLYIEAHKQAFVKEALSGMRGVFHTKLQLVPVKEMVDTVTVLKKTAAAMATGWARIKRGKYKGDIAQVISVDHNKNEVTVKLVPRVDTTDYSNFDEAEAKKRRAKFVPAKRIFEPTQFKDDDLEKWGIDLVRDDYAENEHRYEGMVFKDGFLVKAFPVRSLALGSDVQPELDELKLFEQGQEEKAEADGVPGRSGLGAITSIHKRKVQLQKGDVVRVKDGELRDLLGDVDAINGDTVILRPRHEAIQQKLEFKLSELEKYFEQGDHVKVVGGRKAGITGTVVRVEGEVIYVLTDISHEEVRVFSADLQDTNEVSTGLDVVGEYKLYDLVLLESSGVTMTMPSVGVIVKLEKDVLQVLDNSNKVKAVRPSDVQLQKKSATAVALDSEQQTIGQGDVVKVTEGPMKGKTGTVRHVFRAFLFLYSPSRMENSGVFCVRSRHCTLQGQSKHANENAGPNQAMGGGMIPGRGAPGRGGGMIPSGPFAGRGAGRGNSLEGKRVRITKGFDRNKVGTVKEETEAIVRVELDATHKRVAVKRECIQELGAAGSMPSRSNMDNSSSSLGFSSAGGMTPQWAPQTPAYDGSQTPMHESASTPSTPGNKSYFDMQSPAPDQDGHSGPYTPQTPGSYNPVGASPYDHPAQTPATPAAGYGYGGYGQTPGGGGVTPGDINSPNTPQTPGGWGSGQGSGFLSGGASSTFTPYDQASPSTPATPGGGERGPSQAIPQAKNWCIPHIEVRVVSGEYIDRVGVVVELQGAECVVRMNEGGETTTVPAEDLEATPPQKNSSVIILQGELGGSTGKLIGIDGRDGIVKMDLNSDIKIVDMPSLAIHVPPPP